MVLRPCVDFGGGGGGGYVDCFPQRNGSIGGHHFYESIKNGLDSFRLRGGGGGSGGDDDDNNGGGGDFPAVADPLLCGVNDDTSSIASKKRIDSMFKTTASSVAGDEDRSTPPGGRAPGRRCRSLADDRDCPEDYGYATAGHGDKNTVQEKIEKMFAEISSSELDTDVSMESAAAAGAGAAGGAAGPPVAGNKFHVQYIGCAGLSGKISSLEGLQQPVRDMYFEYRENQHQYRPDGERPRDFSGLLEISAAGLTIRYRDARGDTVHRTDAFPSIAVWAALKYVCRRGQPAGQVAAAAADATPYEYAFLPLIADPDGSDKAPLFRDLDPGDRARLDAAGDHAPVFAVVTRCKPGGRPRSLECHGFACETENDALLMAANLYGALVAAMQSSAAEQAARAADGDDDADPEDQSAHQQQQQQQRQQQQRRSVTPPSPRRYIRHRNGFTSMSSTAGSSVAGDDVDLQMPPALPPPRPPRRNKKSASSVTSSAAGGDDPDRDALCGDVKTFRMSVRQPPSLRRGVCNSGPAAVAGAAGAADAEPRRTADGGDILTKVAIPRSRSFLHSNGLASGRYSRRAAGCGIETAADRHRRRSNASSVMGFSDMFNELRVQEGLNNMDEILNAIINAEGMSYNDLKPIYREFLTKVSLTLTKDELYERTKAIMSEQKRKRNKRTTAAVGPTAGAPPGRGRRLNDKLRKAFDLRAAGSRIGAVLLPDFCRRAVRRDRKARKKQQKRRRCACSAEKAAACGGGGGKSQKRAGGGRRTVAPAALMGRRPFVTSSVCSTSDESEFFAAAAAIRQRHDQLKQQLQQQQLYRHLQKQLQQQLRSNQQPYRKSKKRGGKTTATASEAGCLHRASSGYFSCSECSAGMSADDKCFCGGVGSAEPTSLVSCSCDSDSCADSDKCYCGRPRNIFDELKSRGFAASESSVSRADSPGTAWKKNELMMLLQQRHEAGGPDCSSSSPAATVGGVSGGDGGGGSGGGSGSGGGGKCGAESSKSIEYLQVARRPSVGQDPHYSSVTAKPARVADRMKVYGDGVSSRDSTTAAGSSSSPSSSLSAATVYSSSSAVDGVQRQRRSGSSGSDNFRAIDYTLFATNGGRKSRAGHGGRQQHAQHYRSGGCTPAAVTHASAMASRRSYSSEAVHLAGCHVQYQQQQRRPSLYRMHQPVLHTGTARRHSVHDGGADDVLSSFFKSDIENSLGYYP